MYPKVPSFRSQDQLRQAVQDAITIIQNNVEAYDSGQSACYKVIASQLRILVCDTYNRQDNSLLPKVFPNPRFHPFANPDLSEGKKAGRQLIFFMPGTLTSNSCRVFDVFELDQEPIPLASWLDQHLFDETVTIRVLIRSVADKDGGAHVDNQLDMTLQKTYSTFINERESHAVFIVEIGRYVASQVRAWLSK